MERQALKRAQPMREEAKLLLLRLLKGASIADLAWILRYDEVLAGARIYDPESLSLYSISHGGEHHDVPWPILWVVNRYHDKYRWCSRRPDLEGVAQGVDKIIHRIKWQWIHMHDSDGGAPQHVRLPHLPHVPCREVVTPALEVWCNNFRTMAVASASRALRSSRTLGGTPPWSNVLPLTKLGFKLMAGRWSAIKSRQTARLRPGRCAKSRLCPSEHLE